MTANGINEWARNQVKTMCASVCLLGSSVWWRRPSWTLLILMVSSLEALCPPKCICNDETLIVNCERANLENVPILLNPFIQQLVLKSNNITSVSSAFRFYRGLQYLDLGHNKLVTVEPQSFNAQSNLTVLKLSRNEISHLSMDTFFGLHNLTILHLEENILETLPDNVFNRLVNLESLDLSLNQLMTIETDVFNGLGQLRTLRLCDNRLTSVPTLAFRYLAHLFHLDLSSNQLVTLTAMAFSPLVSLQELLLNECGLGEFHEESLTGLGHLRTLKIRDNVLTTVPSQAWKQIKQLEELYFGQNLVSEIQARSFDELTRLRVLEMSGAHRLTVIRRFAFTNNVELRKLILNHNQRLTTIERGAFDGLSSLRHVSLRDDAFRTFDQSVFVWDELNSLDLRDNPIECNCSLVWLHDLLTRKNLTLEGSVSGSGFGSPISSSSPTLASTVIKCRTPSSLEGRLLVEMSRWDLGCNFPDAGQQALFGVVALATLACLTVIVLAVYKHVKRMTSVLKGKWSDGALRHKDLHYEKTNDEEENNILQAAHQSLKMTPVTEL